MPGHLQIQKQRSMTQQGDMTGQGSGSGESGLGTDVPEQAAPQSDSAPAPNWPSPYLSGGESVPEAYPAPPQQGQPRYGAPGVPLSPGQPTGWGSGQPGSAGFGQPGYQQPGYGQPNRGQSPYGGPGAAGRPGPGGRRLAQRDPALAGVGERLIASFVDWILILAVAFVAQLSPMLHIWHQVEGILNNSQYATQSAVQSAINNLVQSPATVSALLTFWWVAFGIALVYFWVLPVIWGATVGKRLFGLRVVSAFDRSKVGVKAAGIRAGIFLLGPAIFLLLPSLEIIGGLLWLADGMVLLLDPSRMQCLHDRLAGTTVIRQRWLDRQQSQSAAPW